MVVKADNPAPRNPALGASPDRAEVISQAFKSTTLPKWYPPWASELADLYFSGTTSVFLLHGNVNDLVCTPSAGRHRYTSISEFLATQVFGTWDLVLHYDLSRGLRPLAGPDSARLQAMVRYLSSQAGDPATWPSDPDGVLHMLDRLAERNLLEEPSSRKSIGVIFEYAQYLVPDGQLGMLSGPQSRSLVRFQGWAQNPYLKRTNIAFCLLAEKLNEVNPRLVQNPYVAAVEVPMPLPAERKQFTEYLDQSVDLSEAMDFTAEQLAGLSCGLSLVSLNVLLSQAKRTNERVDERRFGQLKKKIIERECQGLLEFVEPAHTLDLVVGHEAAKQRLRQDAELIGKGRFDAAPMGYLICGPVGTGKTFLAECYAGSMGIPCVTLRNFRSKYVGETEGNLQRVLTVLRSLGPVVVIIDEADAALGTRQAEGDSGTSSRVFAMIASQMGNVDYRGRIVWMLLTSRPDLLPIDLKRQGRAEVHMPLFYPHDETEVREMFLVMARKSRVKLTQESLPQLKANSSLSGADIESIILAAKRRMLLSGRDLMQKEDLEHAYAEFIPSAQGVEKEAQELAAVLECTQLGFLPEHWRKSVCEPDGQAKLRERLVALKQLVGEQ